MWAGQTKFPGPVWRASPTLIPDTAGESEMMSMVYRLEQFSYVKQITAWPHIHYS